MTDNEIAQFRLLWGELARRPRQEGQRLLTLLQSFVQAVGFRGTASGVRLTTVDSADGTAEVVMLAWVEAQPAAQTELFPSNRALFFAVNMDDEGDVPDILYRMSSMVYGRSMSDCPATILEVRGNRFFRERCSSAPLLYHVLDRGASTEILRDRAPATRFFRQLRQESPSAAGNPFQYVGPVTRADRFVGRKNELRQLVNETDKSFAVIGPRRSGKTSLLYRARDMIVAQPATRSRRVEYIDLNPFINADDAIREIATRLDVRTQARWSSDRFPRLLNTLGKSHDVILFLDEMDEAVCNDRTTGEWLMHGLLDAEHVRVIIAGHGALARTMNEWTGKLWNSVEQLYLGGLDEPSAQELIQNPFIRERMEVPSRHEWSTWAATQLNYAYASSPTWVEYITTQTARWPTLIQLYGWHLYRQATREGRNLQPGDLQEIEGSIAFRERLLNSMLMETAPMTRLLGLILAISPSRRLTEAEFLTATRKNYPEALMSNVQRGLHELEHVGLIHLTNGAYEFAFPAFPRLLEQFHDVGLLLQETVHELRVG